MRGDVRWSELCRWASELHVRSCCSPAAVGPAAAGRFEDPFAADSDRTSANTDFKTADSGGPTDFKVGGSQHTPKARVIERAFTLGQHKCQRWTAAGAVVQGLQGDVCGGELSGKASGFHARRQGAGWCCAADADAGTGSIGGGGGGGGC